MAARAGAHGSISPSGAPDSRGARRQRAGGHALVPPQLAEIRRLAALHEWMYVKRLVRTGSAAFAGHGVETRHESRSPLLSQRTLTPLRTRYQEQCLGRTLRRTTPRRRAVAAILPEVE
jgi:hypothetical protein